MLFATDFTAWTIFWANGGQKSTIPFQRQEYLCLPQDQIIPYHFYFIENHVSQVFPAQRKASHVKL